MNAPTIVRWSASDLDEGQMREERIREAFDLAQGATRADGIS
jgi:hypothetical protein